MSDFTYRIPRVQRALVATGPGSLALKPVPVLKPAGDELLVRIAAVALNPSDHKLLDQSTTVGAVSGSDFAGTVVRVGGDSTARFQIGDHVCGIIFGANPGNPRNGAFAQYAVTTADLCMHIPSSMGFAEAASLSMGLLTAGLAFRSLGLDWSRLTESPDENETPDHSNDSESREYVLVHGGATATGTLVIQLLRMAGYAPIATCSPASFDLVRSRGAVQVFDYASASCHEEIRDYTQDHLRYALDCISNVETMTLCYVALGDAGGRYSALEYYPRALTIRRRDVEHQWILGWTLFGNEVKLAGVYHRDPLPKDREFGRVWAGILESLMEQGRVQPHPLEIVKGPLSLAMEQVDRMRHGRVRRKKVVVQIRSS
ncbi:alcohol dehydrogenase [Aspergillus violaceofuscus CBS 115571]|uniref:Alcohol dehydrogenase n=1 Tax=Aspergillus violaceofuscus (strain CBS 115571) TaxID=1450538 RepID=A0A2V5GYL8_ASPV1|nr:alcohol dehydrogenase [Aspergillus violaceofuscus CBS 115571]